MSRCGILVALLARKNSTRARNRKIENRLAQKNTRKVQLVVSGAHFKVGSSRFGLTTVPGRSRPDQRSPSPDQSLGATRGRPASWDSPCSASVGSVAAPPLFWARQTSKVSFEELNWTLFDRLDIFSDAIDLKNTLVLLFLQHLSE